MINYKGSWIEYAWDSQTDPHDIVHADEFKKHGENFFIGLSECIGIEEDYLVLKSKENIFRAKPWHRMKIYPPSKFKWNDKVKEVQRPEVHGIVDFIVWHYKDADFKYFLIVNGKRKSRQYNSDELELI